ncbi:relaxase domain-containing protein [Streptomyces sp. NPDC002788]
MLEWIEDEVAVIRYGKDGIYRVRPPGGLVAARFRHYEARSGMPLLHDHLLLSVKGQRLDGKWGSIHTLALHEKMILRSTGARTVRQKLRLTACYAPESCHSTQVCVGGR